MSINKVNTKKLLLLGIFIILGFKISHAQCSYTTENGTYDATCFESLFNSQSSTMCYMSDIEIAFVKLGAGRVLVKSGHMSMLKGNAYIYLEDNTIIKLIDRNKTWTVNQERFQIFNLTRKEVQKLKDVNIKSFRASTQVFNDYKQFYNIECLKSNWRTNDKEDNDHRGPVFFPALISAVF